MRQILYDKSSGCYIAEYETPSGYDNLMIASDGFYITAIKFVTQEGGNPFREHSDVYERVLPPIPVIEQTEKWLYSYFSGISGSPLPPLKYPSTASIFQKNVWGLLNGIPYGCTCTYGALALEYSKRYATPTMSARAIGQAVGKNPFCILVPCHRVVGKGGCITGYAWGIRNKIELLTHENIPFSFGKAKSK